MIKPMTGDALKAYRESKGATVEALAEVLGVSFFTIDRFERCGSEETPFSTIIAMACESLDKLPSDTALGALSGDDVKAFREKHVFSRARLADLLGLRRETIYHYENAGKREVPKAKMLNLALYWIEQNLE